MTEIMYRPCWVEIDCGALASNWRALRGVLGPRTGMLAVVKANAYGHGLVPAARVAAAQKADLLGVSGIEEGIALRRAGLRTPVLILGSLFPFDHFSAVERYRLTPTVASLHAARALNRLKRGPRRRLPVHLKIDSGFGRIGVQTAGALAFIRDVARLPGIAIEGLYTHFASADIDAAYTRLQTRRFMEVVSAAARVGVRPRWIHMANSSALLRFAETHGTLVRPGLAYYGIAPYESAERRLRLKPALCWKSRVIFSKMLPRGAAVSYARTWTARRATRVATLAVGYADGYPRSLSNRGQVLLHGRRAPVIGRVTMDMLMVDATGIADVQVGDEAVLIGEQAGGRISARELADRAGTNAYELLSRIAERVTRIYP